MVYFTSDMHSGHRGIIDMQERPFESVQEMNRVYFALMHYPMLSWPKKNSDSIQLHGHIHAREDYNVQNREDNILRYDVGIDANHFLPVSIKRVIEFFEKG